MRNSQRLLSFNVFIYFLLCIILLPKYIQCYMTTIITHEYYSPESNFTNKTDETQTNGFVSTKGSQSIVRNAKAFILTDINGTFDGCKQPINPMNISNGIAIIQRGGNCTFSVKITHAKQYGASAVIIYEPFHSGMELYNMLHNNSDILSVYVQRSIGSRLFNLAKDIRTQLNITLRPINIDIDNSLD
ncbi:unnamed protein product [Rotaria sp. Silwood1]|nr:unnamed protein product [Rotaria sp. Silwood1]CAF1687549.1 unnamed protein product [Rotaria sp. Silwood1]